MVTLAPGKWLSHAQQFLVTEKFTTDGHDRHLREQFHQLLKFLRILHAILQDDNKRVPGAVAIAADDVAAAAVSAAVAGTAADSSGSSTAGDVGAPTAARVVAAAAWAELSTKTAEQAADMHCIALLEQAHEGHGHNSPRMFFFPMGCQAAAVLRWDTKRVEQHDTRCHIPQARVSNWSPQYSASEQLGQFFQPAALEIALAPVLGRPGIASHRSRARTAAARLPRCSRAAVAVAAAAAEVAAVAGAAAAGARCKWGRAEQKGSRYSSVHTARLGRVVPTSHSYSFRPVVHNHTIWGQLALYLLNNSLFVLRVGRIRQEAERGAATRLSGNSDKPPEIPAEVFQELWQSACCWRAFFLRFYVAVTEVAQFPSQQTEADGLPEAADFARVEQIADGHELENLAHHEEVSAGSDVHPCTRLFSRCTRRPILIPSVGWLRQMRALA